MVDSANDLSIEVFLLKKKYDVDAFYTVVNELLDEFVIDAIEDDSPENLMSVVDRISVNIGKKITNQRYCTTVSNRRRYINLCCKLSSA